MTIPDSFAAVDVPCAIGDRGDADGSAAVGNGLAVDGGPGVEVRVPVRTAVVGADVGVRADAAAVVGVAASAAVAVAAVDSGESVPRSVPTVEGSPGDEPQPARTTRTAITTRKRPRIAHSDGAVVRVSLPLALAFPVTDTAPSAAGGSVIETGVP